MQDYNKQALLEKWAPVLDHEAAPEIKDSYRKFVTAVLLENQERDNVSQRQALFEATHANAGGSGLAMGAAGASTGTVAGYDPVLISLVRRAMPQLMAYDVCGVQPMNLPTGLIFAMKSRYTSQSGTEALFNEADSDFGGAGTHAGSNPVSGTFTTGTGMTTAAAEGLGDGSTFNQMAFSIEKVTVTAKSRALKAEYTQELAQDLKAVHGLDAEQELSNILSSEILAEINREVMRTIYTAAKDGAQAGTATAGTFDLDIDSNGRWSVEKFKGLMFQIERDANVIAQQTRRGRGNFVVCSSDVASALAMAGKLDYAPALSTNLNVDEASTTFAGILNGKYKVFVDPYIANGGVSPQFALIGYKGSSAYDAGLFYCPYVPLQMVRAVDPSTFQPKIAFKTRYGLVANPFTTLDSGGSDGLAAGKNYYFRKIAISNLM
jgi:hypothetical protein